MKRTPIAIAVLAAALAAQPAITAAQRAPDKPRAGMQMDPMMHQQMTDRMKGMQAQMDKIHQTADPKERETLMGMMQMMMEQMMQHQQMMQQAPAR